jgi:hypothetical protein
MNDEKLTDEQMKDRMMTDIASMLEDPNVEQFQTEIMRLALADRRVCMAAFMAAVSVCRMQGAPLDDVLLIAERFYLAADAAVNAGELPAKG